MRKFLARALMMGGVIFALSGGMARAADEVGQVKQGLGEACGVNIQILATQAAGCANSRYSEDMLMTFWLDTLPYREYRVHIDITNGSNYTSSIDDFYVYGSYRGGVYSERDWVVVSSQPWSRGLYQAFITVRDARTYGIVCVAQSQLTF